MAAKIDASEKRLLDSFERGEWTGVTRLATARARYAGVAKARAAAFQECSREVDHSMAATLPGRR